MVQTTEVFSFPVLMWSNHRTGQFCGSTEAAASQAEPDPNDTSCPCNDCTKHHKFLWDKITLTVPLQQIKTDFSAFVTKTFTGLSPYPPISACLLSKSKEKPVWGLKTSLDVKEKLANLDLNIYFGHSRSCWLVLPLHVRSHILYSCEPWGLLWGFVLWGAGMVQMVSAYVWALNTDLKLHHQETTDLPRVHSFPTAQWEIKKYWIQMSPFSVENYLKCYQFYFWWFFCILSSYFLCLVPL